MLEELALTPGHPPLASNWRISPLGKDCMRGIMGDISRKKRMPPCEAALRAFRFLLKEDSCELVHSALIRSGGHNFKDLAKETT